MAGGGTGGHNSMADAGTADEDEVDVSVRAIWEYMRVGDPAESARGSDDGRDAGKPMADAVLCGY